MNDDAGKPVTVMHAEGGGEWPAQDPRLHVLTARLKVISRTSGGARKIGLDALTAIFGIAVIVSVVVAFDRLLPALPVWVWLAVAFGVIVAISIISGRLTKSVHAPLTASAILREGICPCCGYNLADTNPDPNGFRVCSECGATWATARTVRTVPFEGSKFVPFNKYPIDSNVWVSVNPVKDAVGNVQPIIDHIRLHRRARKDRPTIAARLDVARRECERNSRPLRWTSAAIVVALTAFAASQANETSELLSPGPIIVAIPVSLVVYLLCFGPFTLSHYVLARMLARHGICAACGSELPEPHEASIQSSETLADRALVNCDTCLATWRRPLQHPPRSSEQTS